MRDRLVELLNNAVSAQYIGDEIVKSELDISDEEIRSIADRLLANGVIVPPCKVGDVVYALWDVPASTKPIIYCAEVKGFRVYSKNCRQAFALRLEPTADRGRIREYLDYEFGKTVFPTREEAERALKGGAE